MNLDYYSLIRDNLNIRCNSGVFYIARSPSLYIQVTQDEIIKLVRMNILASDQQYVNVSGIYGALVSLKSDPFAEICFTEDWTLVNLENSVFDLKKGSPITDRTGLCFNYFIDAHYQPKDKRKTDTFDKFCLTSFANIPGGILSNGMPVERVLLLEIIGICISDIFPKLMFLLIGESNSGKSVILNFLVRLLNKSRVVGQVALGDLSGRFYLEGLQGKKLNVCPEFGPKDIQRCATVIKKITSSETIRVERKRERPEYKNIRCTLISAGNESPILRASGIAALISRMIVLVFSKSIPPNEQDPQLLDRLWEEKDSIVSESLDALVELKKRGFAFSLPQRSFEYIQQLREKDPLFLLQQFLEDCAVFDVNGVTRTKILTECFGRYLSANAIQASISHEDIIRILRDTYGIPKSKVRFGEKTYWSFRGIRIKDAYLYDKKPKMPRFNPLLDPSIFSNYLGTVGTQGIELPKTAETQDLQANTSVPDNEQRMEQPGTKVTNRRKIKSQHSIEHTEMEHPFVEITPENICPMENREIGEDGFYTQSQYIGKDGKIYENPFGN